MGDEYIQRNILILTCKLMFWISVVRATRIWRLICLE